MILDFSAAVSVVTVLHHKNTKGTEINLFQCCGNLFKDRGDRWVVRTVRFGLGGPPASASGSHDPLCFAAGQLVRSMPMF